MKRLLFAVALLLAGAHAQAQTSEAEVQADLLAIQIASAVKAERLADAAKLLEEYAALGVTMPPPLILQGAVVYERFLDAEVQFREYLKKSERGSEDYKRAVLMLAEVEPKAKPMRAAAAAKAKAAAQRPGRKFRDCKGCPEMVIVPAGSFTMGSPTSEEGRSDNEGPQHRVTLGKFAVGRYEVSFDEWEVCRRAGGCSHNPGDEGWGKGKRPVMNVSWEDAKAYVKWLSRRAGKRYRLLSESEWEYAVRAGTTTPFHTGQTISTDQANYNGDYIYGSGSKGVYRKKTIAVGSYPANKFGLHDMHGNVWEWVEDCWHDNYEGAPSTGGAWTTGGNCAVRVLRGGSWINEPWNFRSAFRYRNDTAYPNSYVGFRVARVVRTLTP